MHFVCSTSGWSAVTSATANATLAGVLAGFMLNGIVVLLSSKPDRGQRTGYVQAASLLFAAFIALGLDAYLFGLVTGENTTILDTCRRAWTEAMLAAGLLGVGAVAVIGGFVFLLGVYFSKTVTAEADDPTLERSQEMLSRLCRSLRPGVALVVIFLFIVTTRSYLSAIFKNNVPDWALGIFYGCLVFDAVIAVLYVAYMSFGSGNSIMQRGDVALKTLKAAIYVSVVYSLLSVSLATLLADSPLHFWASGKWLANIIISAAVIWVLVVSLVPLAALLVPSFGPDASAAEPASVLTQPAPGTAPAPPQ